MIPLTIVAKNEEAWLGTCLDSLLASAKRADVTFDFLVVLDDTVDESEVIARARGIATIRSTGGKVEGMRAGSRSAPFQIFSDGDITVDESTLPALAASMLSDPSLQVAFPPKLPLTPRKRTPLAAALHTYNRTRGFSSAREWFSGKLFAIRDLSLPTPAEIQKRALGLEDDPFYELASPLRVDDIYLSRAARGALRETEGCVHYRAPETLRGMYLYYRRMRREIERTDRLFPDLPRAPARRYELGNRSPRELADLCIFEGALALCRAAYRIERAMGRSSDPWLPVPETKIP